MGEATHKRVDLAVEQLGDALRLFLDEQRYASALTLAGAAEEVLGRAVEHGGGTSNLQWKFSKVAQVDQALFGKPLKWSEFVDEENAARNALKHMREPDEHTLDTDLEMAAVWMLVRACDNYRRLGLEETEEMGRFTGWFYENVVGI